MKKKEKITILKWYIKKYCSSKIQTKSKGMADVKGLELLVMNDRTIYNIHQCSTCCYDNRDYYPKCMECKVIEYGEDECERKDNYTFPYGYWKKFYDIDGYKEVFG